MKHQIVLKELGHIFECNDDQSILAAGLEAGFMLPYNCRSGFCRTCKSRIVHGDIAYADLPMTHYLSPAEHAAGLALLCQANPRSDLVIEADEIINAESVRPRKTPCRIVALDRVAPDVLVVRLRLPMNENIRYFPGQHLAIELSGGVSREYSLARACRPEGMTELEIHVRHKPGGLFTDRLFGEMAVKALLRLDVPLGTFFLRSGGSGPVILMATGTGFAPVRAMIEHAIATGEMACRDFALYWGGRNEADLYMADLARDWACAHPRFTFVPVLSRQPADSSWSGRTGYVQDHVSEDWPYLSGCDVYACGSPAMIESVTARFAALGNKGPARLYVDEFLTASDRAARERAPVKEQIA